MIDILIAVLSFNVLIVIFKLFQHFKIDNLQALIVNYFTAGLCSIYFSGQSFSIKATLNAPWFFHALIIGIFFVVFFNLYIIGTQKVGIAVTTIANKLSLLIPVSVALIIYPNEKLSTFKTIGFIMALIGIYLSATKGKKLSFDKRYLWLIILVFAGQGIADAILNHAQYTYVNDHEKGAFFTALLFIAGIVGVLILIVKSIRQKQSIQLKNGIGGILLGIPNFISIIFLFNALESSGFAASQVFPIVSMGIVVVSAFIGLLLFKEKLTLMNWIGLGFSILAIFIITFY